MDRPTLEKLIEAIVAEVVRRVALLERQKQHPERVLVLLTAPVAYPKELKTLLQKQFGVGYTTVSFPDAGEFDAPELLHLSKIGETELLRRVTEAKTVILVGPRLELLERIAAGDDRETASYLVVRSILWRKDVRLYLDFEPPQFLRDTFAEGVASAVETLRRMSVAVCPYYTGDAAERIGATLVTEADVLEAAKREDRTICCRQSAIITPAARDALREHGITLEYEGETICN